MNKTPGVRQRNHGWARMVREQRREEAVARNKAHQANKPHPVTPEEAVAALKAMLANDAS
jgi:hypothetical protein